MALVKEVARYLESIKVKSNFEHITVGRGSFKEDLYKLSICNYMISSPSTFAIWAAILSSVDVKVVHSQQWVDYCVGNGEEFWMNINNGGNEFYRVWDTIDG
mgnify:CR=1 FL=1